MVISSKLLTYWSYDLRMRTLLWFWRTCWCGHGCIRLVPTWDWRLVIVWRIWNHEKLKYSNLIIIDNFLKIYISKSNFFIIIEKENNELIFEMHERAKYFWINQLNMPRLRGTYLEYLWGWCISLSRRGLRGRRLSDTACRGQCRRCYSTPHLQQASK